MLAWWLGLGAFSQPVAAEVRPNEEPMQDAPLRVVTKEIEPFVFAGDELSGFSIDLWEAVARSIERDYEFVVVDAVSEQLEAVTQNRADAARGHQYHPGT